jgi:hypothetical protein
MRFHSLLVGKFATDPDSKLLKVTWLNPTAIPISPAR